MNIFLWILQGILALLFLTGGGYKLSNADEVAEQAGSFSGGAWRAIGVIEVVGAILLIVPAALNWMPGLTPLAAALLAVESLVLSIVYGRKSLAPTASNPLMYSAVMGILAACIAYGRYFISPFA